MKNKEIEELWKEHESGAFPASCRGVDVRGIDLVSLDADAKAYYARLDRLAGLVLRAVAQHESKGSRS